jgi:AcrR family transcriptional regulator
LVNNLNMSSAAASSDADDRSTRARIRDAALACFAETGVKATTVRRIAEQAGVSAGLVIHHFGSKAGLRSACDAFVAAFIRERKVHVMRAGHGLDPLAVLREQAGGPPIQRYLARTLAEGTPEVAGLVEELIDDAERYLGEGVERGLIRRLDHPRGVAAVLTFWSLGALVLHTHVERVLGIDLTGPAELHASNTTYVAPALEILTRGLVASDLYEGVVAAERRPSAKEER